MDNRAPWHRGRRYIWLWISSFWVRLFYGNSWVKYTITGLSVVFTDVTRWMTTVQPKTSWRCASHTTTLVRSNSLCTSLSLLVWCKHSRGVGLIKDSGSPRGFSCKRRHRHMQRLCGLALRYCLCLRKQEAWSDPCTNPCCAVHRVNICLQSLAIHFFVFALHHGGKTNCNEHMWLRGWATVHDYRSLSCKARSLWTEGSVWRTNYCFHFQLQLVRWN